MIHIIVIAGTQAQINAAEALLRNADGYSRLMPGVWFIAHGANHIVWRDHLKQRVEGLQIFVGLVTNVWATAGFKEAANWLKESQGVL